MAFATKIKVLAYHAPMNTYMFELNCKDGNTYICNYGHEMFVGIKNGEECNKGYNVKNITHSGIGNNIINICHQYIRKRNKADRLELPI